jgi:arylsulfatase A-like enzyme
MKSMRHLGAGVTLFTVMLLAACSSNRGAADQRHNVIIIISDALRQDVLGCYGGEARTPNIDRLARDGVLFENAYANAPWTVPSSVSMLTGNYATSYGYSPCSGTIQIHVPAREIQLAEALREAGYTTLAKVDNMNGSIHNNLQGFELLPDGREFTQVATEQTRENIARIVGHDVNHIPYSHLGVVLTHLLEMREDQPFFALYWMFDPHEPYAPIARFKERVDWDISQLPNPPGFYEQPRLRMKGLLEVEREYMRRRYVVEVESVDERVGFIVKVLRHRKLLDSTYIVFASDHGELFGEHGLFGHHGYFYEVSTRVPLIVAGPQIMKGKRQSTPVSLVDLMPTLSDLLGAVHDQDMQGQSLQPLLTGETNEVRSVYFETVKKRPDSDAPHVAGLLKNGFKLVLLGSGGFELYNLRDDREETLNAIDRYPDVADTLRAILLAQREQNATRAAMNMAEPVDTFALSPEELEELDKQLRAVGYIK